MNNLQSFDESKINWNPMPNVEHAWISILDIDEKAKVVDILLKFAANEKIVLHRHSSVFNTFVIKGEHRLYDLDGELTEVRPVGTYKVGLPSMEPHREGAGSRSWTATLAAHRTIRQRPQLCGPSRYLPSESRPLRHPSPRYGQGAAHRSSSR